MRNLDPPVFMADCIDHDDCKDHDVAGPTGQYCAKFGQNKCTYKKVRLNSNKQKFIPISTAYLIKIKTLLYFPQKRNVISFKMFSLKFR